MESGPRLSVAYEFEIDASLPWFTIVMPSVARKTLAHGANSPGEAMGIHSRCG
uniref:hypothetical protein n=1 Tax=Klebsiella pneumoniae TaxID=573 RepID=UPI00187FA54F|nr:hypothetical protein [Klebsiella pneumoniae]